MSNCPFCILDNDREVICSNEFAFAIYDKYAVSPGHALIISKRHCPNFFDLSMKEQEGCLELLNQTKELVDKKLYPDGYNIGVNVNEVGGQTIPHVHLHLIPRYKGDVLNPRGGVRGGYSLKKGILKKII